MSLIQTTTIGTATLYHGDSLLVLPTLSAASIDAIVTDPPYELGFMGKKWDGTGIAYNVALWRECLRILKPGGHLLSFGGSRTYHRMACAIEDAGFEIRDQIMWLYGSGFPKSHNLEGEWAGRGTALKPAHEPVVMARKQLIGTVAANVETYGIGALNIDWCRVQPTGENLGGPHVSTKNDGWDRPWKHDQEHIAAQRARWEEADRRATELGRWPANVIHDGSVEVLTAFPDAPGQQGDLKTTGRNRPSSGRFGDMAPPLPHLARIETDKSAARFFYCAKASKKDRETGNTHPTVKPLDLMRYLCRLVTPPGGTVLDPFSGSGSTGKAAALEGFKFIGVEREAEYFEIACQRIAAASGEPTISQAPDTQPKATAAKDEPQFALFA
jgi:DNA modification methylase